MFFVIKRASDKKYYFLIKTEEAKLTTTNLLF